MNTILEECAKNISDEFGTLSVEKDNIQIINDSVVVFIRMVEKENIFLLIETSSLYTIKEGEENDVKSIIATINDTKALAKLKIKEDNNVYVTCGLFLGRSKNCKFSIQKCLQSMQQMAKVFNQAIKK